MITKTGQLSNTILLPLTCNLDLKPLLFNNSQRLKNLLLESYSQLSGQLGLQSQETFLLISTKLKIRPCEFKCPLQKPINLLFSLLDLMLLIRHLQESPCKRHQWSISQLQFLFTSLNLKQKNLLHILKHSIPPSLKDVRLNLSKPSFLPNPKYLNLNK